MSLNGLDDAKVQAAHDAAIAESGGWFLLKYASRDEIETLDSGIGGIVDIRNAIGEYKEPSPLYGFLMYRRKSVIIKYMPEDCSRLLQARATVHFNAICEHFTHDTTFEISEAKELGDRKLSAACSLHVASGSTSSSTSSLQQRILDEIAEEEEEKARKLQSVVKEGPRPTSSIYSDSHMLPSSPEPTSARESEYIIDSHRGSLSYPRNLLDYSGPTVPPSPSRSESNRRLSSQSARLEVYSSASYTPGRKVKLGPRPSQEIHKKISAEEKFRPVAALPAGFKFKGSKKGKSQEQEQSEQADFMDHASVAEPEPSAPSMEDDLLPPLKPIPLAMPPTKESKISPEKARLMKAMKLREKKLQEANKVEQVPPTHPEVHGEQIAAEETVPDANCEKPSFMQSDSSLDGCSAVGGLNAVTASPELDSGDTVLDSHPSSPGAASSMGVCDSTKASSLSESTDETIQAAKELSQVTDNAVESDVAEVSDIVEDASLHTSALHAQEDNTAEPAAHTSQSETIITEMPTSNSRKDAGELAQIPENEPEIAQTAGIMNRNSVENDDNTADFGTTLEGKKLAEARVQEAVNELHESGDPNSGGDKAKPNISGNRPNVDPGLVDKISVPPSSAASLGVPPSKSTREDGRSPVSQLSPTIASLKSKFSRKDVSTDANVSTPETTVISTAIHEREVSRRYIPSPEIQVVYPPKFTRQKVIVEPIRTDLPVKAVPKIRAADPLDDDALMDELQTATVQEAKPITVSKSPITPVFPSLGSPSIKDTTSPRAASNPMRSTHLMPSDGLQTTARSASMGGTTFFSDLSRRPSNASTTSKKGNVGSSISQRIKALEALSGQPADDRPRPSTPSATFFGVRKQSKRESSRAPSVLDRPESRMYTSPTSEGSTDLIPDDAAGTPTSLRQPTMLIDIQKAQSLATQPPFQSPMFERPQTGMSDLHDPTSGLDIGTRRSSLGLMKSFLKNHILLTENSPGSSLKSPSRPPSSHTFQRRSSASSRRSSNHEGDNASISGVTRASSRLSDAGSIADDDQSDKKSKSRTANFMRRLSNSLGGSRKGGSASVSPTLKEEDTDQLEGAKSPKLSPTIVAFMGDVNVQFPDNLLWKRRSMCLDAQGFLFLSSVQGAAKKTKDTVGTKRFHLGDFRKPYIPDVEVQELPNSVVLDFLEGSSLQIACGDRAAQLEVLRILQEAHQTHSV